MTMLHTCYHIFSDHTDEYVRSLNEVRTKIDKLDAQGKNHIQVSQIFTEEDFDSDAVHLNEVQVSLDEIEKN
jgi:hypothetical protein